MNRRTLDILSVLGLLISGAAVYDLLARWEVEALKYLYLLWGIACALAVCLVLLFSKARLNFQEICKGGSPLLWLRLLLSALLFVFGWYVNAASAQLYGADSPMVEGNAFRMFCVLFTMVAHVFYFAYTKKQPEEPNRRL